MTKALDVTMVYGMPLVDGAKELPCLAGHAASAIITVTLPAGRVLGLCQACAEAVSMDLCTALYGYQVARKAQGIWVDPPQ